MRYKSFVTRFSNQTETLRIIMKQTNLTQFVALLSLIAATGARADLTYTFDSDAQGFTGGAWSAGRQAFQATPTAGGWTLGAGPFHEFAWPEQIDMQSLANSGTARISFTLSVDGGSWTPGVAQWFQFHYAANSDGSASWTQDASGGDPVNDWHNADDTTLRSWTFDHSFGEMGWQPGDSWFQLYFGSNSDGSAPVKFYVDDVHVYSAVPEPSILALVGLGGAALLSGRRRK